MLVKDFLMASHMLLSTAIMVIFAIFGVIYLIKCIYTICKTPGKISNRDNAKVTKFRYISIASFAAVGIEAVISFIILTLVFNWLTKKQNSEPLGLLFCFFRRGLHGMQTILWARVAYHATPTMCNISLVYTYKRARCNVPLQILFNYFI